MSGDAPHEPSADPTTDAPETRTISPDDAETLRAAWAATRAKAAHANEQVRDSVPTPGFGLGKKIIGAALIAAIGIGASIMSCIGQSFSYRQARAMEGIEQQLKEIRASCPALAPAIKN